MEADETSKGFVCDETRLPADMEQAADADAPHWLSLARVYEREHERDRRLRGLPLTPRFPARLPGPPPSCDSYRQEAQDAAMIGGQRVSRLLKAWGLTEHITVPSIAVEPEPTPGPKRGIVFKVPLFRWLRRLLHRGSQ